MSERPTDRDTALKAAVREALEARDRRLRAPGFGQIWPGTGAARPAALTPRPAFAALGVIVVLAGVSWIFLGRHAPETAPDAELRAASELARELSSPDYWRVPTDALLAFAAPPLSADLPAPEGFNVSLEESLL